MTIVYTEHVMMITHKRLIYFFVSAKRCLYR